MEACQNQELVYSQEEVAHRATEEGVFILARKGQFHRLLKDDIVNFIEDRLFGELVLTPKSSEEDFQEVIREWGIGAYEEEIRRALAEGKSIYLGDSGMLGGEREAFTTLMSDLWFLIQRENGDRFEVITGEPSL